MIGLQGAAAPQGETRGCGRQSFWYKTSRHLRVLYMIWDTLGVSKHMFGRSDDYFQTFWGYSNGVSDTLLARRLTSEPSTTSVERHGDGGLANRAQHEQKHGEICRQTSARTVDGTRDSIGSCGGVDTGTVLDRPPVLQLRVCAGRWSSCALAVAPGLDLRAQPVPYCVLIKKCAAETLPFDSINSLMVIVGVACLGLAGFLNQRLR